MKQRRTHFKTSVAVAVALGAAALATLLTDTCCAPQQPSREQQQQQQQADAPPVLDVIGTFHTERAAEACTVYPVYPNSWGEYSEFAVVNGRERTLRFREIIVTFWVDEQVCAVRVVRNVTIPPNSVRPVFFAGVSTNPYPNRVHAEFVE